MRFVLLAAVPAAALAVQSVSAQSASIVYRLGNDTVAIETFERTNNRMTGVVAQRQPSTIGRMTYDVTWNARYQITRASIVQLSAGGDTVSDLRLTQRPDSLITETATRQGVQRRAFPVTDAFLLSYTYANGLWEILESKRRSGAKVDSVPAPMPQGLAAVGLTAIGNNRVRLRSMSYPFELQFDAAGRLQQVDGSHTTNKVIGTRTSGALDAVATIQRLGPLGGALSTRDVARATWQPGRIVLIDYGRPLLRGRTSWGGTLVPMDSIWRMGANEATHLFTTHGLDMGTLQLPPGQYTLFMQHRRDSTYLIVNRRTGIWGTQYDSAQDVGRVVMTSAALPEAVEQLTIAVRAQPNYRGVIEVSWDRTVWRVPFTSITPPR